MKILVISLLRLGDIILHVPAIKSLKRKYPDARIDVYIHKQFYHVTPLISDVKNWILFDREGLQQKLGQPEWPLQRAYWDLSAQIHQINSSNYDLVINLTHTTLSGWLMSAIQCAKKEGLCLGDRPSIGNRWLEYLNRETNLELHFADLFSLAAGNCLERIQLNETTLGQQEASAWLNENKSTTLVQVFTSDSKKNWQQFEKMLVQFSKLRPDENIVLLGAPNEEKHLQTVQKNLSTASIHTHVAICSLPAALSLIRKSQLLITGDTAIKHLASATDTPVLELALGSSKIFETGAFHSQAIVIEANVACAPCIHSVPCHYPIHVCSSYLVPQIIARIAYAILKNDNSLISEAARDAQELMKIYRTNFDDNGTWTLNLISGGKNELRSRKLLEACA